MGWMGESKAGDVKTKNVFYQAWDAKGWDKVGAPGVEDIQCYADLGINQTWGIKQRDRVRKSLVAMRAPGLSGNHFF